MYNLRGGKGKNDESSVQHAANCRSYTGSRSGLCGYHEQKAIKLEERLDAEQHTPEDRARYKLMHAQTFEKFTAAGDQRKREEQAKKQREWKERQQKKIDQLAETIRRLEISAERDADQVQRLHRQDRDVRPGRNASEIQRKIWKQIDETASRRADKMQKIRDMQSSLARMRAELSRP